MVSSNTISEDYNIFKGYMDNYSSLVSSLSDSWSGASFENIVNKGDQFISEYLSVIADEVNAFSTACSLYVNYCDVKNKISTYRNAYNSLIQSGDNTSAVKYSNDISMLNSSLNTLKSQIEENLSIAKKVCFGDVANPITLSGNNTIINNGSPLGIDSGTYGDTFTSSQGKTMKYYAYVPNGATEGMPLIIYMHGDGSVGNYDGLKEGEMAKYVKSTYGDDFPFIFVQPNTEVKSWTQNGRLDTLAELIQDVATTYKCDPNKIILSGGSRGGNGAWEMANKYSDMFSAFVPISGISSIDANNFTDLPTLAVSTPGSSDSWNYSGMKNNVNQINNAGGNATFVSLDGYNHNTVLSGIFNEETFNWMISQ